MNIDKRCIMLTISVSNNILAANQTSDPVLALNDAIVSFVNSLRTNDFLCVNIGTSKELLLNDMQDKLTDWKKVKTLFNDVQKYIKRKDDYKLVGALLNNDMITDNNNDLVWYKNSKLMIQGVANIVFNCVFVGLYSWFLILIWTNESGDCYSSYSLTPLFDDPKYYGPTSNTTDAKGWNSFDKSQKTKGVDLTQYTNVSLVMKITMLIEIFCGLFFVVRAVLKMKYNMKKGTIRQIYLRSNYFWIVRCINLMVISYYLNSFRGGVCFCRYRSWFHEHCYYDNIDYSQYMCYAYK